AGAGSAGVAVVSDFDVDALAARVAPREALVAYRGHAQFTPQSGEPGTGVTFRLSAFVLRGARKSAAGSSTAGAHGAFTLELVDLGPVEEIGKAVSSWRELLGAPLERGLAAGNLE